MRPFNFTHCLGFNFAPKKGGNAQTILKQEFLLDMLVSTVSANLELKNADP